MGPHERKLRSEMLRRGGRVVEGTSLENWQRRKAFVGSNPTLSATVIARNQANKPSNFPGPVTRPAAVSQLRARGVSPNSPAKCTISAAAFRAIFTSGLAS
jgi:hypothetical protein